MFIKVLLALYPLIVFIALVFIFKFFRLRHLTNRKLKITDVFTIFLILGMQIFSKNVTSISIIPYYLLIISGLALVLLLLDLLYYKQFTYRRFLKLWWRLTFFITLIIYLILIVITFTH
ncbi:DUF3397 domain-containing protein [Lactococcus lactis]|uniref:DUF3397 domain-containing protein n=1 Tax=Lactococcus lactis TaxID=1358 RepID=UPI003D168943